MAAWSINGTAFLLYTVMALVALTMLAGHRPCGSGWLVADWAAQET
jgi:hypothetical protein